MDEMSIRKQIDLDGHKSYGFIDYGTVINDDSVDVAKEAFVLLLAAVNGHWKIPVAYFLTDGLNSKEKANIISECLIKVHETGVQVISLTSKTPLVFYTKCGILMIILSTVLVGTLFQFMLQVVT